MAKNTVQASAKTEFKVGKTFLSADEMDAFFERYEEEENREVGKHNTSLLDLNNPLKYHSLSIKCAGFGIYETRGKTDRRKKPSKKCNCTFQVKIGLSDQKNCLEIKKKSCFTHTPDCDKQSESGVYKKQTKTKKSDVKKVKGDDTEKASSVESEQKEEKEEIMYERNIEIHKPTKVNLQGDIKEKEDGTRNQNIAKKSDVKKVKGDDTEKASSVESEQKEEKEEIMYERNIEIHKPTKVNVQEGDIKEKQEGTGNQNIAQKSTVGEVEAEETANVSKDDVENKEMQNKETCIEDKPTKDNAEKGDTKEDENMNSEAKNDLDDLCDSFNEALHSDKKSSNNLEKEPTPKTQGQIDNQFDDLQWEVVENESEIADLVFEEVEKKTKGRPKNTATTKTSGASLTPVLCPFNKKTRCGKAKILLQFIMKEDKYRLMNILEGSAPLEVEEMSNLNEYNLKDIFIDECVDVNSILKYYLTDEALAFLAKIIEKKNKNVFTCNVCKLEASEETEDLVGCDMCLLWYHCRCVKVTLRKVKNKKWYCKVYCDV